MTVKNHFLKISLRFTFLTKSFRSEYHILWLNTARWELEIIFFISCSLLCTVLISYWIFPPNNRSYHKSTQMTICSIIKENHFVSYSKIQIFHDTKRSLSKKNLFLYHASLHRRYNIFLKIFFFSFYFFCSYTHMLEAIQMFFRKITIRFLFTCSR